MIVDRLLRPKSGQSPAERRGSCLLWIFGAMLLAALFLRAESWLFPEQPKPLLEPAAGLIQSDSVADVEAQVGQDIPEPTELLGATVAVVGYYAQPSGNIPAGSSAIVLAKDNWRFVEILIRPGASYDEIHASYGNRGELPVLIGDVMGTMMDLTGLTTKCVDGMNGVPGICKLSHVLLFPYKDGVVTIAADGPHATEGELITIARSMIE